MPVRNKKAKNKIGGLAYEMRRGFRHLDKKIDKKIDGLALMTKRGFDDVDKKFHAVDKKFHAVDKKFHAVDKRFDHLEKEILDIKDKSDYIFAKLVSLDRRVMFIEDRLTEIVKQNKKEFQSIKRDLKELKGRRIINEEKLLNLEGRVEKLELKLVKS